MGGAMPRHPAWPAVALVLLLVAVTTVRADVFVVATNGTDVGATAATCTSCGPFACATLACAHNVGSDGDTVLFRAGTYGTNGLNIDINLTKNLTIAIHPDAAPGSVVLDCDAGNQYAWRLLGLAASVHGIVFDSCDRGGVSVETTGPVLVDNCTAADGGLAFVSFASASVVIRDSTVTTAPSTAIYVSQMNAKVTIEGTTFVNNVATAPLIVAELQAELSLRESLFRDSATVAASMVLADSVVLLVNDVRFEDNFNSGALLTGISLSLVNIDSLVTINNTITGTTAGVHISNIGGEVPVSNSRFEGTAAGVAKGGGLSFLDIGNILINNCDFVNNTAGRGGGLYMEECTQGSISGGIFESNSAIVGGAMESASAVVLINLSIGSASFTGNEANTGGAMSVGAGSVVMGDVTAVNNKATTVGGALHFVGGSFTSSGSNFVSNSAGTDGGAVYMDGGAILDSFADVYSDNDAENGGAVFMDTATATIRFSTFERNHASRNEREGGAIYAVSSSVDIGVGCVFASNDAVFGGAVAIWESPVALIDGTVMHDNQATHGGAILLGSTNATVSATVVRTNNATEGGGIYVANIAGPAFYTFTACNITQNQAALHGGGLFATTDTAGTIALTVADSVFDFNVAVRGGAAYVTNWGGAEFINVTMSKNHATEYVGGLYLVDTTAVVLNETVVSYNTADVDIAGVKLTNVSTAALSDVQVIANAAPWINGTGGIGGVRCFGGAPTFVLSNVRVCGNDVFQTFGCGALPSCGSIVSVSPDRSSLSAGAMVHIAGVDICAPGTAVDATFNGEPASVVSVGDDELNVTVPVFGPEDGFEGGWVDLALNSVSDGESYKYGGFLYLRLNGSPCASGAECASGICPDDDKVCCATACDGVCATCSRLGSAGTCRPHTSSSDPDNDCPGMQVCNGAYACRDPLVATTSVAPAVCPVITSVSPKLMVLAGGQLTITGTGFDGASIWIGSKLADPATVVDLTDANGNLIGFTATARPATSTKYRNVRVEASPTCGDTLVDAVFFTDDCPEVGKFGRGSECIECEEGADCPGGHRMWPMPGWWTRNETEGWVKRCLDPPGRCLGGQASECAPAYGGDFCGECAVGYFKENTYCAQCSANITPWILLVANISAYVILIAAFLVLSDIWLSRVVFVIALLQIVRAIGQMSTERLPVFLREAYQYVALFAMDFMFLRPGCAVAKSSFQDIFIGNLVMIACLVVPSLVLCLALSRCCGAARREFYVNRTFRLMTICMSLTYLVLVTRGLQAVRCTEAGGVFYLQVDMAIVCYQGTHLFLTIFGGALIVLVGLGYPAFVVLWLHHIRHRAGEPQTLARWGFLYETLRDTRRHFVTLEYLVIFTLAFGAAVLINHPIFQVTSTSVAFLLPCVLLWVRLPYATAVRNAGKMAGYTVGFFGVLGNFLSSWGLDLPEKTILWIAVAFLGVIVVVFTVVAVVGVREHRNRGTPVEAIKSHYAELESRSPDRKNPFKSDSHPHGPDFDVESEFMYSDEYAYSEYTTGSSGDGGSSEHGQTRTHSGRTLSGHTLSQSGRTISGRVRGGHNARDDATGSQGGQ